MERRHSLLEFVLPTSLEYGDELNIFGIVGQSSFSLQFLSDYMAVDPHRTSQEERQALRRQPDPEFIVDDYDLGVLAEADLPIVQIQPLHITFTVNGAWDLSAISPETSTSCHGNSTRRFDFTPGRRFECKIFVRSDLFLVYMNGTLVTTSEHLVPLVSIQGLFILGDAQVQKITYGTPINLRRFKVMSNESATKDTVPVIKECCTSDDTDVDLADEADDGRDRVADNSTPRSDVTRTSGLTKASSYQLVFGLDDEVGNDEPLVIHRETGSNGEHRRRFNRGSHSESMPSLIDSAKQYVVPNMDLIHVDFQNNQFPDGKVLNFGLHKTTKSYNDYRNSELLRIDDSSRLQIYQPLEQVICSTDSFQVKTDRNITQKSMGNLLTDARLDEVLKENFPAPCLAAKPYDIDDHSCQNTENNRCICVIKPKTVPHKEYFNPDSATRRIEIKKDFQLSSNLQKSSSDSQLQEPVSNNGVLEDNRERPLSLSPGSSKPSNAGDGTPRIHDKPTNDECGRVIAFCLTNEFSQQQLTTGVPESENNGTAGCGDCRKGGGIKACPPMQEAALEVSGLLPAFPLSTMLPEHHRPPQGNLWQAVRCRQSNRQATKYQSQIQHDKQSEQVNDRLTPEALLRQTNRQLQHSQAALPQRQQPRQPSRLQQEQAQPQALQSKQHPMGSGLQEAQPLACQLSESQPRPPKTASCESPPEQPQSNPHPLHDMQRQTQTKPTRPPANSEQGKEAPQLQPQAELQTQWLQQPQPCLERQKDSLTLQAEQRQDSRGRAQANVEADITERPPGQHCKPQESEKPHELQQTLEAGQEMPQPKPKSIQQNQEQTESKSQHEVCQDGSAKQEQPQKKTRPSPLKRTSVGHSVESNSDSGHQQRVKEQQKESKLKQANVKQVQPHPEQTPTPASRKQQPLNHRLPPLQEQHHEQQRIKNQDAEKVQTKKQQPAQKRHQKNQPQQKTDGEKHINSVSSLTKSPNAETDNSRAAAIPKGSENEQSLKQIQQPETQQQLVQNSQQQQQQQQHEIQYSDEQVLQKAEAVPSPVQPQHIRKPTATLTQKLQGQPAQQNVQQPEVQQQLVRNSQQQDQTRKSLELSLQNPESERVYIQQQPFHHLPSSVPEQQDQDGIQPKQLLTHKTLKQPDRCGPDQKHQHQHAQERKQEPRRALLQREPIQKPTPSSPTSTPTQYQSHQGHLSIRGPQQVEASQKQCQINAEVSTRIQPRPTQDNQPPQATVQAHRKEEAPATQQQQQQQQQQQLHQHQVNKLSPADTTGKKGNKGFAKFPTSWLVRKLTSKK